MSAKKNMPGKTREKKSSRFVLSIALSLVVTFMLTLLSVALFVPGSAAVEHWRDVLILAVLSFLLLLMVFGFLIANADCIVCGKPIGIGHDFCPSCGFPEDSEGWRICVPYGCNNLLAPEDTYCRACGLPTNRIGLLQ